MRTKFKVKFNNKDFILSYYPRWAMFVLTPSKNYKGEEPIYLCDQNHNIKEHNTVWVLGDYVDLLESAGVVERGDIVSNSTAGGNTIAHLCKVIHPTFNDGGFSDFGDFARNRLGCRSNYMSMFIEGKEGFPELGKGLRFKNIDAIDDHKILIHREDMEEFEKRFTRYRTLKG